MVFKGAVDDNDEEHDGAGVSSTTTMTDETTPLDKVDDEVVV